MSSPALVSLSPRLVFDPDPTSVPAPPGGARTTDGGARIAPRATGWRAVPAALINFYGDRLAWLALGVTSVVLSYVGGLVMFWFHAVELGEGGPAISWYAHWLLDSTFAFLFLTPALAVIIPLAVWAGAMVAGPGRRRAVPWLYAIITGALFSLVTTPGPIAHDLFVGRGTWVADRATELFGDPAAPLAPAQDYELPAALTQQLGAGIMLYLAMTGLSVLVVRAIVTAAGRRRPAAVPAGSAPSRNAGATGEPPCHD
jgi:hypothetical protein